MSEYSDAVEAAVETLKKVTGVRYVEVEINYRDKDKAHHTFKSAFSSYGTGDLDGDFAPDKAPSSPKPDVGTPTDGSPVEATPVTTP
jgi:hypothetical protein